MGKYSGAILSALVVIVAAAAYATLFFLVLDEIEVVRAVRIGISVVSLLVVIGVTAALVSRIKELRGGQENDIGKY